ncbi:hypothetical protein EV694_1684 [Volucribacter psittacicida]|uniref:Dit-like phage tail protein N-terminal domain-containing protein n=1 Tax=Volucribacter psittacicida TaxID=203482 RepID=A0A4R1FNK5_9PAST|nr:hypothetical protein [Volucribacter psittacicida]TCJ96133.1 hypothetical protein EV694_1684 [Volucribacter psittacicida]
MFWDSIGVPNVPGIPQNISGAIIKFGGSQIINQFFGNYWGIFDQNGIPLLLADNVKSVKYQNTSKISNAPLEKGSFTSYNKVIDPYIVDVVMTKGSGGVIERGAFLALVEAFANSTDLFMVITPEAIYPNCNIIGYNYMRETLDGARLLKVNIKLQEIREIEPEYTSTKSDTSATEQNSGNITTESIGGTREPSLLKRLNNVVGQIKEKGLGTFLNEGIGDLKSIIGI